MTFTIELYGGPCDGHVAQSETADMYHDIPVCPPVTAVELDAPPKMFTYDVARYRRLLERTASGAIRYGYVETLQ